MHCRELCKAASKHGTACSRWPASMRPATSGTLCAPLHSLTAFLSISAKLLITAHSLVQVLLTALAKSSSVASAQCSEIMTLGKPKAPHVRLGWVL